MPDREKRTKRRAGVVLACTAVLVALLLLANGAGAWGVAMQSVFDRLMPGPEVTMWARTPQPDEHADSYDDATGAGRNYIYHVEAATEQGAQRTLAVISFGGKASGQGFWEIQAKGGSGVRYRAVEADDVPEGAKEALRADG